jgi:hypothetical protein
MVSRGWRGLMIMGLGIVQGVEVERRVYNLGFDTL